MSLSSLFDPSFYSSNKNSELLPDIIWHIISFTDTTARTRMLLVSKQWRDLIYETGCQDRQAIQQETSIFIVELTNSLNKRDQEKTMLIIKVFNQVFNKNNFLSFDSKTRINFLRKEWIQILAQTSLFIQDRGLHGRFKCVPSFFGRFLEDLDSLISIRKQAEREKERQEGIEREELCYALTMCSVCFSH